MVNERRIDVDYFKRQWSDSLHCITVGVTELRGRPGIRSGAPSRQRAESQGDGPYPPHALHFPTVLP